MGEIEYFGHRVGKGLVSIPEVRIKALSSFKKPQTKKDLISFFGMIGYYRTFIPVFSSVTLPLTKTPPMICNGHNQWEIHLLN